MSGIERRIYDLSTSAQTTEPQIPRQVSLPILSYLGFVAEWFVHSYLVIDLEFDPRHTLAFSLFQFVLVEHLTVYNKVN